MPYPQNPPQGGCAQNEALSRAAGNAPAAGPGILPLAEFERLYIERVIAQCGGNIPRAAAALQVAASTIYRKKAAWDKAR